MMFAVEGAKEEGIVYLECLKLERAAPLHVRGRTSAIWPRRGSSCTARTSA